MQLHRLPTTKDPEFGELNLAPDVYLLLLSLVQIGGGRSKSGASKSSQVSEIYGRQGTKIQVIPDQVELGQRDTSTDEEK